MKHLSSSPEKSDWWSHETDRTQLAELSTVRAAVARDLHAAGWRRNATYGLLAVLAVAALVALRTLLT